MSIQPKEEWQAHRWKIGPECFCELRVSGGLTAPRLARLRAHLDLLEPSPPVEGPHETDYPERTGAGR